MKKKNRTVETVFILKTPYIKVSLGNNNIAFFCIDTGSPLCVLDSTFYLNTKINTTACCSIPAPGNIKRQIPIYNDIEINNKKIFDYIFARINLKKISPSTEGLVGGNFLNNKILFLNYETDKVGIISKLSFIHLNNFDSVELKIKYNKPYIFGNLVTSNKDTISGDFLIDTGFGGSIMLNPIVADSIIFANDINQSLIFKGNIDLYGNSKIKIHREELFYANKLLRLHPIVNHKIEKSQNHFSDNYVGIIGCEILSDYIVMIDYHNHIMYYKPNRKRKQKGYYRAGFSIGKEEKGGLQIKGKIQESPADSCGIKIGDILIEANGIRASKETYTKIIKLLRTPGILNLKIKRNDSVFNKKVPVKKLF